MKEEKRRRERRLREWKKEETDRFWMDKDLFLPLYLYYIYISVERDLDILMYN